MMIKTKFLCGTAVDCKETWVKPLALVDLRQVSTIRFFGKVVLHAAYSRRQGYLGDVEQCTQLDGRSNPSSSMCSANAAE